MPILHMGKPGPSLPRLNGTGIEEGLGGLEPHLPCPCPQELKTMHSFRQSDPVLSFV